MMPLHCVDLSLNNRCELDAFICIQLGVAELLEATLVAPRTQNAFANAELTVRRVP